MQISPTSQVQNVPSAQPSISQPAVSPNAAASQAPADTVTISDAAKALARTEITEGTGAESAESVATQIKEGE